MGQRFRGVKTVEDMAKKLWRDPEGVKMIDPRRLVDVVRARR